MRISLSAAMVALFAGCAVAQGGLIGLLNTPGTGRPVGLGSDPSGDLWLTVNTGTVYQLNTAGTVLRQWTPSNSGTANGITSDGTNVYVTDSSRATGGPDVDVYDQQGNYIRSFPATNVRFPAGIEWHPLSNTLYVMDRINIQAIEFDLQGNQVKVHAPGGLQNDGIGYDSVNDEFWVYSAGNDTIDQYDPAFNALNSYPGPGSNVGSKGRGLAYVAGVVYIAINQTRQIAMYDATGQSAGIEIYGAGCPRPGVFYELFQGTGTGDLAGKAFLFDLRNGNRYIGAATGVYETNIGPSLPMSDDTIIRNNALGFSFTIPGAQSGSTTAIDISSNGWIGLNVNGVPDPGFATAESGAEFVKYARIAGWWDDLDPSVSGSVHFNTLTNPRRAVITWDQVTQFGGNDKNTFQITLFGTGDFTIAWQAGCLDDALTGFSSGGNPADPGPIDLTGAVPGQFGPFGVPLGLTSSRPVLGQNVNYQVSNIPSSASLGGIIYDITQTSQALDQIGMPGCTLLTPGSLATGQITLPAGQFSFPIPNVNSLIGKNLYHQAVVVAPGVNPLGVVVSNGLKFTLGL